MSDSIKIKLPAFRHTHLVEYKQLFDALFDRGFHRGGMARNDAWRAIANAGLQNYWMYVDAIAMISFLPINEKGNTFQAYRLTVMNSREHFLWYVDKFRGRIGK